MDENEARAKAIEFERNRNQLLSVSAQKQQLQFQSNSMKEALDELEKTKEKKVFKAVGNILIQEDTIKVKKELKEKRESIELRVKTLQKQEDSLINKLNKLKADLEGMAGQPAPAPAKEEEEKKKK